MKTTSYIKKQALILPLIFLGSFIVFLPTKVLLAQNIEISEDKPVSIPFLEFINESTINGFFLTGINMQKEIPVENTPVATIDDEKKSQPEPEQENQSQETQIITPVPPPTIASPEKTIPKKDIPKPKENINTKKITPAPPSIKKAPEPYIFKRNADGKKVCNHKNDKPQKSDKGKKKHMDMECCLDPDETPNPNCYYPSSKYGKLLKKFK
ncbi:MAG TPA: hypothetical protein DIT56_04360 [Candidatus Moranbacteria bacterium]|nr:hypothetical protein [Candidatus Moranbacteria bacterium]